MAGTGFAWARPDRWPVCSRYSSAMAAGGKAPPLGKWAGFPGETAMKRMFLACCAAMPMLVAAGTDVQFLQCMELNKNNPGACGQGKPGLRKEVPQASQPKAAVNFGALPPAASAKTVVPPAPAKPAVVDNSQYLKAKPATAAPASAKPTAADYSQYQKSNAAVPSTNAQVQSAQDFMSQMRAQKK